MYQLVVVDRSYVYGNRRFRKAYNMGRWQAKQERRRARTGEGNVWLCPEHTSGRMLTDDEYSDYLRGRQS